MRRRRAIVGTLGILKKLNRMFTRRHRIALLVLLGLMVIGALLEAVGLGLLPAFVLASVEPERLMNHEWIGPVIERLDLTTPRKLLMGGSVILKGEAVAFVGRTGSGKST